LLERFERTENVSRGLAGSRDAGNRCAGVESDAKTARPRRQGHALPAAGGPAQASRQGPGEADGAARLFGSSLPIRILRDRVERVAVTDFTVLIEGAIGPQPHPNFIEVFGETAFYDGDWEVEGAEQDGAMISGGRAAA
jgi:hypothetical protein